MKNITLFILLLVLGYSCTPETAELSLKLEIGNQYYQTTSNETTIIQNYAGQEMKTKVTLDGTTMFDVKNLKDDVYLIDMSFQHLSMTMEMPNGSVYLSTDVPDNSNPMYKILKYMINRPFEMNLDTKGKVTSIDNCMDLWEDAINQFDELSEDQKSQIKSQIEQSYGPAALKGSIEMLTAVYPDHIVNTGEQWTVNTSLESGMSAKLTTEYKFVDRTSEHCLVTGISTIKSADKDAYVNINGMPTKYDISGDMTSEITIDNITGWITKATITQNISGDVYIKENPDMPEGMVIPMTMTNKMTITDKP